MERAGGRRALCERAIVYLAGPIAVAGVVALLVGFRLGGADLEAFLASGRALAAGQNPYPASGLPNLNPPILLFPFALLARLDRGAAFVAMDALTLALYALVARALWRSGPLPARKLTVACFLAAYAGLWNTLFEAQLYAALAALVAGAFFLLRAGRAGAAGALLGVAAAAKPNLAVALAVLLAAGQLRAALGGALTAGALSGFALLVLGPGAYRAWLALLPGPAVDHPTNASLTGLAAQLGAPAAGAALGAALVLLALLWAWRRRPPAADALEVALVVALLASPIDWPGYAVLLLPLFFSRPWTGARCLAALLFLAPQPVFLFARPEALELASGLAYAAGLAVLLAATWRDAG